MSSTEHTISAPGFTIEPLVVPDSVDAADAADFIAMAAVRSSVEAEQRGDASAEVMTAADLLPAWKDPSRQMTGVVAKVDGRVVARANLALPVGASECWGAVSVLPGFRGRGIGSALYDRLERMARDAGRTTIQNQTTFPAGTEGPTLPAPTGFGSVPLALGSTRFLQRQGFSLEQVGRVSALPLPLDAAAFSARMEVAVAAASGYRTVSWQRRTPEEWLEALALLHTRMSTDAPNAGMQQTEDVWTVERVREFDDLWADSPRTALTTIAVEEATGEAAGFTQLEVPAEPDRPAEQTDTLVLREHRGRRLGMLMKLTNLRRLTALFPAWRSVETVNAEENRPMLDVNESIGFTAVAYVAGWRKDIGAGTTGME
ncbi:GNAT family N-acetyltransferase [Leifsonia sp. fls2-241-R2A-40a]|uniref:GNAT family N-acetyltransferase n=1 Tax=Leifsonia sp. fls2-241-R2A-40a TaxID=3040290 RepID=UPI002550FFF0|nr:GNAT family N-acetyltransferase [Leifsonia sp. fls2-241-R2A-40a]